MMCSALKVENNKNKIRFYYHFIFVDCSCSEVHIACILQYYESQTLYKGQKYIWRPGFENVNPKSIFMIKK